MMNYQISAALQRYVSESVPDLSQISFKSTQTLLTCPSLATFSSFQQGKKCIQFQSEYKLYRYIIQ